MDRLAMDKWESETGEGWENEGLPDPGQAPAGVEEHSFKPQKQLRAWSLQEIPGR